MGLSQLSPTSDRISDAFHGWPNIALQIALPESEHEPSIRRKLRAHSNISAHIALKLFQPIASRGGHERFLQRPQSFLLQQAGVPVVAVNEYSNAESGENNVRLADDSGRVYSEAKPYRVQPFPQGNFRPIILGANRRHVTSDLCTIFRPVRQTYRRNVLSVQVPAPTRMNRPSGSS